MNERDESERTVEQAWAELKRAHSGHPCDECMTMVERAIESREREQTLALLEALRAVAKIAQRAVVMIPSGQPEYREMEDALANLAGVEAAHALQVAPNA